MGGLLRVFGAAEHNLQDVDATIGPGLTAVVGVSGSGKSSLAFDVIYAEARRRFIESLGLGGGRARQPAAHVRRIDGLGPAVSIAQNVLNRNSASTVATAVGLHPFLRVLYARFSEVTCPRCVLPVRAVSREERLAIALDLLAGAPEVHVDVAIVRAQRGIHRQLLTAIRDQATFDVVAIDGRDWAPRPNGRRAPIPTLDPKIPHDIVVRVATIEPGARAAEARAALEMADGLGSHEVRLNHVPILRAPICPGCGGWVRPLEPSAFRDNAGTDTTSHTIAGVTLPELLSRSVAEALEFIEQLPLDARVRRVQDELLRRIRPLVTLGLGHLALDRPMPTLSRGEAQRTRLAVVLAGRLDDLLHVLDEPTIGLHHSDLKRLLDAIAVLPGPVLMVEHDAMAIAMADDVIEIGPGGGRAGGRLVFQGPPAELWKADTASGRGFSSTSSSQRQPLARRAVSDERIRITGARHRNLTGIDVEIPIGALTVITGPSGAGKTTLARDTLLASLVSGVPTGCMRFETPTAIRALAVDQAPLGNNPRSNPATYTKVFDRIRDVFATATGRSASEFTFNRPEGACPECEGMGSVEVHLRYIAPVWVPCEACEGRRYRAEVLDATWSDVTIAELLELSVDDARALFASSDDRKHKAVVRILDTLRDVGLGYITLGQPSPTLSGGEAQRVRLAREITKAKAGDLVLLDEPTTGLHPADLERLLAVLHRLTDGGCTVVVVEHQHDVIDAADWRIDLGPGGGPDGGRLMHQGPPAGRKDHSRPRPRPRTKPRARKRSADVISVRNARAHNLQSIDVDFAKNRFTVVTGVSGSGKSSLVNDVVAAEATRRLLECLSVYERQSVREGPEAPVDVLTGLGPTVVIDATTRLTDLRDTARATVGRASDLDRLVALVMARAGTRTCLECDSTNVHRTSPVPEAAWRCDDCDTAAIAIEPRNLVGSPLSYCKRCLGIGSERRLLPERYIKHPDRPICAGCFGTNGHVGYLCGQKTGGSGSMRAFAERHGFDPRTTPWSALPTKVQDAFLHGDPEPYQYVLDDDGKIRVHAGWGNRDGTWSWRGMNPRGDFGGKFSEPVTCGECDGKRLRPPYLAIRIDGLDRNELFSAPLVDLEEVLSSMTPPSDKLAADGRAVALRRLEFLRSVGLGYLHLDRNVWTLSAGEAQRIKLASVLGGGLRGMTVLIDEPSRGMHPSEVNALASTLTELRDAGNTVIAVEHDPTFIRAADEVIEIGPGPGRRGGRLVDIASQESVTRAVLEGQVVVAGGSRLRREPAGWMHLSGAAENNLRGLDVRVPLGVQVGVCGVSGSGKSSLVVDTIALALSRPKTDVPGQGVVRVAPGKHDSIQGAPERTVVADQSRAVITSPGMFLGLIDAVRKRFAASEAAVEQGIDVTDLVYGCDACNGTGSWQEAMSFLPSVTQTCDACGGSGYPREAAALVERGRSLADIEALTLAELVEEWEDIDVVRRMGEAALTLGLGYLIVRQPGWSLSGGEAQRLKLAKELARPSKTAVLYVLDEPTVGLQATDVAVLSRALDAIVDAGNSVLVVEHDPMLLATCDWLIELGPGAGPSGGEIVFEGTPEDMAKGNTATSPYVLDALT